jgi:integrase
MDLRAIQIVLKRLGSKAGLWRLTPKVFRTPSRRSQRSAGVPMPMAQAAMGHTSISTTSIYFNQSVMQHAAGAQQWTPLDALR